MERCSNESCFVSLTCLVPLLIPEPVAVLRLVFAGRDRAREDGRARGGIFLLLSPFPVSGPACAVCGGCSPALLVTRGW